MNLWTGTRVALICDYYDPVYVGGAEWSVRHLAEWLAVKDTGVVVVTPSFGETGDDREPVLIRRYPVPFKSAPVPYWQLANPWWYLYSARHIARICQRENASVLHCQGKHSLVGTWLAARWMLRPCVATLRDYQALCRYGVTFDKAACQWPRTPAGLYHRADAALKRYVLRDYDEVVVLSEAMRRIYAQYGVEARVIHNTVEAGT